MNLVKHFRMLSMLLVIDGTSAKVVDFLGQVQAFLIHLEYKDYIFEQIIKNKEKLQ